MIDRRTQRIAFVGDSITWGDGMLGDGFVGEAISHLQQRHADTRWPEELRLHGVHERVTSRKLLGSSGMRFRGAGSGVSFDWPHAALHLIVAVEREQPPVRVRMLVDGRQHDEFVLAPARPSETVCLRFVGDGETAEWDLGRAQTYAHRVAVDGVEVAGGLNTAGYGFAPPPEEAYTIVRKYSGGGAEGVGDVPGPEVRHALLLPQPLPPGRVLEVRFRSGETLAYARTTIGEVGPGLDAPLESRFGQGDVAFDPAHPTAFSSGLDFRSVDERAVRSWRFAGGGGRRHVRFEVVGWGDAEKAYVSGAGSEEQGSGQPQEALATEGVSTAVAGDEPYWIVNAVADQVFPVMNAGIGGWTARLFNEDRMLRSVRQVVAWQPDIVFVGLGTNDDWEAGNTFVATRSLHGVREEAVRRMPVVGVKACRYDGPDTYTVESSELVIAQAEAHAVTIAGEGAVFGDIRPGDVLVVGDYDGDNRNVQCRLIAAWDGASRTARFDEPLRGTVLTPDVAGYRGQAVRIKRAARFVQELSQLLRTLQAALPAAKIALIETGLSHYHTRLLMGYPELIRAMAAQHGCTVVPVYEPLLHWQYAQPQDVHVYVRGRLGAGEREGKGTCEDVGNDAGEDKGKGERVGKVCGRAVDEGEGEGVVGGEGESTGADAGVGRSVEEGAGEDEGEGVDESAGASGRVGEDKCKSENEQPEPRDIGSSSYDLVASDGRDIHQAAGYLLRNWSVQVNGEKRLGRGCRLDGGYRLTFRPELTAEELAFADWQGRSRNPRMAYRFVPTRLIFNEAAPEAGAALMVRASSAKWSGDDAHLNMQGGLGVYTRQVLTVLDELLQTDRLS